MSKGKPSFPQDSTPIDHNELQDLIPDYISTVVELNQAEQANIADAFVWAGQQSLDDLLTASFIFKLHEKMFNQVWRWAGKKRNSNKNIGVMKEYIMNELNQLLGDTKFWIENQTFSVDEIAIRFHHRLVQIHIFPNGNGRHSRLMTDLLLKKLKAPKFSWGTTRAKYISALKLADQGDFKALLIFARSS